MSQDDKDFLFGYQTSRDDREGYITLNPRKTIKSPSTDKSTPNKRDREGPNTLNLTEEQKKRPS